ncbi:hypothetical protein LBMAG53_12690 [Planctomycetota bacterium]|nr:hypothetical protein LBMAG53_12690 [Planctomycetota bacterium]
MPQAYIIAGPNGAGKTTFARVFLPVHAGCMTFNRGMDWRRELVWHRAALD